jgi:transcriptional regulator with XRE-family HTH domain
MGNEDREIADRFCEIRAKTGLSQTEFGQTLGLSHTVIAEIERSSREPSRKVMVVLSQKYNISLDWLLLGVGKAELSDKTGNDEVMLLKKENSKMEADLRKVEAENKQITHELVEIMKEQGKTTISLAGTTTPRNIFQAVRSAHKFRDISVIIREIGVDKITDVMQYKDMYGGFLLSAHKVKSHKELMSEVAQTIGISSEGKTHELIDGIIGKLKGTDAVFIIDQAECLSDA